jgi:lysine-specific demethylase 3
MQRKTLTSVAGPKAYCAHTSQTQGSTCLHTDMSDAINLLTYASPTPNGQTGYAT